MCFPSIIPPPLLPLTRHYIANPLYVTMTSLSLPLQMSTRQYATMRQMKAPAAEAVERLASGSAVVVFSVSTCCMCHVVKRLFFGIGVSPTVVELDKDARGRDMERVLSGLLGGATAALPAVFIGGRLLGGMDRVMASHINGTLVNLLRDAGALWL